jgi:hypothetical protein
VSVRVGVAPAIRECEGLVADLDGQESPQPFVSVRVWSAPARGKVRHPHLGDSAADLDGQEC